MDKRLSMISDDHKGPYVTIFKKVVHVGLFGTLEACFHVGGLLLRSLNCS